MLCSSPCGRELGCWHCQEGLHSDSAVTSRRWKSIFLATVGISRGHGAARQWPPPPAEQRRLFLYVYICIISGRRQRLLLIMLYLQPPTNTDVAFPAERQILSLLSTLCPGQRAIMWGSSNGRRGEQRGAWLTDLFQSSCSLGQGVRQLACAFFESSISRTAPCPLLCG